MSKDNPLPPTPQRIRKSKRKGEDPQSKDVYQLTTFLVLIGAACAIYFALVPDMRDFVAAALGAEADPTRLLKRAAALAVRAACILVAFSLIGSVFGHYFNRRTFPGFKPVKFQYNPTSQYLKNFRPFSLFGSMRALIVSIVSIVIIIATFVYALPATVYHLVWGTEASLQLVLVRYGIGTAGLLAVFLLATIADRAASHREFLTNIRMNQSEVKREQRDSSGNPEQRAKRNEIAREGDGVQG